MQSLSLSLYERVQHPTLCHRLRIEHRVIFEPLLQGGEWRVRKGGVDEEGRERERRTLFGNLRVDVRDV